METKHYHAIPLARFFFSFLMLAFLLSPFPTEAADPGSLKGKITDKTDGEAVIGASAMLENTTLGSASDIDGNYTISNIPSGTYKLKVNAIGYTPFSQTVTISPGQAITLNPQLGQTTVMASEIIVGAALYEQDRLDVPVTTSVVTSDEIKEEPSPSLDKVIETVPGVVVNRGGGYGTSTVQIRGSNTFQGGGIGTRVQGLYDGFPINTPVTGEVVWTNVNMNSADKVEILKGAAATLYGSGAMGGVVNVFGSLPDKFEVKAGASGGFYDNPPDTDISDYYVDNTPWLWNGYIGIGNKTEKLNYSLLYTHADDDGHREATQTELNDVKLKARFDINSDQYLQLTSFYNQTEGGYPFTWPFDVPFTFAGPEIIPHPELAYDVPDVRSDDIIKRKNALIGLNYVNLLSDKLSLDSRLYYTHNDTRINYNPSDSLQQFPSSAEVLGDPVTQGTFSAIAAQIANQIATTIANASAPPNQGPGDEPWQSIYNGAYASAFPTALSDLNNGYIGSAYNKQPGDFNQTISDRYGIGVKLDWQASDHHRFLLGVDANTIDVQSSQYTAALPAPNTLKEIGEKNIAIFLQDELKMTDRLTALLSVRYDWSGIDADEVTFKDFSTSAEDTTKVKIENKSVEAISPRIALNYRATDNLSFRGSWGKSFRAPTLSERFVRDAGLWPGNPNPALDKETMTAYEIGFFTVLSDRASLDVAAYLNDYDNLIESIFLPNDANELYFIFENFRKARIWGIETSLNLQPVDQLSVNLGYSYMNAKIVDYKPSVPPISKDSNPDPEWLPMRPEHTASVNVIWQPVERLSLNSTARYVSEYKAVNVYTNPVGENYPGDFIVVDAGFKYKVTDNLTGSFLCKNITNKQYEEAEWFRSPGRSFILGLDFVY